MSKIDIVPFEGAEKALFSMYNNADIIVTSNTPLFSLNRDWVKKWFKKIHISYRRPETGTKEEMINVLTENKYKNQKTR